MFSFVKKVILAESVVKPINHYSLYIILILGSSILITNNISSVDSIKTFINHKSNSQLRIVGADSFVQSPWPFYVALDSEQVFCGGVILDKRFILTAASCVNSTNESGDEEARPRGQMSIRTGSHSFSDTSETMVIKDIKEKCVTTGFKKKNKRYYDDFALLFLNETLDFSGKSIEGVGIYPDQGQNETRWYENADCYVIGLSHESLNITSARVRLFDCKDEQSNESVFCFQYLYDAVKTCQADLGDPIVCSNNGGFELLGTISSYVNCDELDEDQQNEGQTYRVARFQKFYETSLRDCVAWFNDLWKNEGG